MSQRSPSAYPSYKPDPVTAWMAVAGSGLIPRKATSEPPILPANRSSVAYPLAGRGKGARSRRRHRRLPGQAGPTALPLSPVPADRLAAALACSRAPGDDHRNNAHCARKRLFTRRGWHRIGDRLRKVAAANRHAAC